MDLFSLHFLSLIVLMFVQEGEAKNEVETIQILAIVFLVLCVLIMITGIVMIPCMIRRINERKVEGKVGRSYRLDHKYDGAYKSSMYGSNPRIVVTESTTKSQNEYISRNDNQNQNGHARETTTSYENASYERSL